MLTERPISYLLAHSQTTNVLRITRRLLRADPLYRPLRKHVRTLRLRKREKLHNSPYEFARRHAFRFLTHTR